MSKYRRAAVAAAAGVVASALTAGAPVGAQESSETPRLTISPASGPAGTVVTVSGDECPPIDAVDGNPIVDFALVDFDITVELTFDIVAVGSAVPADDGTWSGQLTVPAGLDPDRDHVVVADCNPLPEEFNPDYDFAPFDVTGGGSTSTPPTTEPTVDDEPDGEPPVAPPAVPVAADPTFAG